MTNVLREAIVGGLPSDGTTLEAEFFESTGYRVRNGSKASDGQFMRLRESGGEGELWTTYTGPSGVFALAISAQDESDGQSLIAVEVGGRSVGTIALDRDGDGGGSDKGRFGTFTLDGVEVAAGDEIRLVVDGDRGEFARIDKIDLTPAGADAPIVIEAEHFHEHGFRAVRGDDASGGALAKLDRAGKDGRLWTAFQGEDGRYDLALRVQDESDGRSEIVVRIGGAPVGVVRLDRDGDGRGSDDGGFTEFRLDGVEIAGGDVIDLVVDGDRGEFVRVDRLALAPSAVSVDGNRAEAASPAPEGAITVGFDVDANGDTLAAGAEGTLSLPGGLTVTAIKRGAPVADDAMIFDAANPTGGDVDLLQPAQGGVLIVSEDGDETDPDDNAGGGVILAEFDRPATVTSVAILDVEEPGGRIELLDANGDTLASVAIPTVGDGEIDTLDLGGVAGVSALRMTLVGSGAIDDLTFVPGAPAAPPVGAPPAPADDTGRVCDGGTIEIAVLGNDADPDGDTLEIVALIDGAERIDLTEGTPVALASGAEVTPGATGTLVYDASGTDAFDALAIGEDAIDRFEYVVDDGTAEATAGIAVTVKGDEITLETVAASLPEVADGPDLAFTLEAITVPTADDYFDLMLSGTGDARFDGVRFEIAYCLERREDLFYDAPITAEVSLADAANVSATTTNDAGRNIDIINWILNQGFETIDAGDLDDGVLDGDGTAGRPYTEGEIQAAIWGLTDGDARVGNRAFGKTANAREILEFARSSAEAETFVPGEGDIVTLFLDPDPVDQRNPDGVPSTTANQAFIVGVPFEDLVEECACPVDDPLSA